MMNQNYMRLVHSMNRGTSVSYLVDDYSPVVAYSTQKISSSITNVIRLRRDSDNAESDFTASEILDGTVVAWGDVASLGAYVVKLYNQGTGGSTYDIVQSTATNQPKFVSNAGNLYLQNGLATLSFDSSANNYMSVASTPFGQVSNSFFAVSSASVTETSGSVLSLSNTTTQSLRIFQDSRTATNHNIVITNTSPTAYAAGMSTARTSVNTLTLLSSFIDASKGMSSFDNSATGGTNTFTGTWTNDAIQIGRQGTGQTYLGGKIAEFIGFATDEISSRTDIETNINDRFSIY